MRSRFSLLLVVVFVPALGAVALAAEPPRTTITLKELDCPACAKRLATKLKLVPGVADVKSSVETRTATVLPRPNEQPSPRALWESTEKAGFEPVKLEGPAGTFTNRPR
jgi:copper chaperone CopZ